MHSTGRLVSVFLFVTAAWSQVSTGTIVGVVEDSSGAVIANAEVTVKHGATGETRATRTNDRGEFNIPFVRIGPSSVTAGAPGFKTQTLTGINLLVDQTINLRVKLEVGAVTDTVEVTGSAPLVDSSTSSLGQVIENKKIVELPLNGRNAFALGLLAGNTVPVTGMGTNLPFVAGGGRFSSNDVMLDGIDNNTSVNAGSIGRNGIAYTPSVDAVQEFKVKTNNFSAEFGRSGGAIISATIKSGGNALHGSAWEFLRNDKLDANSFFANAGSSPRQPFKQNQFGFTLGGPVVLPKLYDGHNRTFFFMDYEGLRRRTSASSSILDIPPLDFRMGDFSKYNQTIYNPAARRIGPNGSVISDPFPGNIIPKSQLNPASLAILGLLPAPNFGAPNAQSRNYLRVASSPFDNNQYDVKIDQRVGSRNNLFGRISRGMSSAPNPGNFNGFIGGGSNSDRAILHSVLSDTHIFTPNVVNEFRTGYTRNNDSVQGYGPLGAGFARQNNIALFPFPIQSFPSIAFNFSGQVNSQTQFTGLGGGDPNISIENTFEWADNLSINRGAHSFKAGADIRRYRFDNINGGGQLIFGSIFSSSSNVAGSGSPLADFLMGFPSGTQGTQLLDWSRQRDLYAGVYFQDDWKLTSRLTLNYGIRYDLYTQPVDARDRGGLFDIRTGMIAIPGKNGYSRAIVKGDHNNFAPRLGFAWNATSKFVVRAGAGVFYARRDQNQSVTQIGANIPNVPGVIFPAISASGTVTPPVTINSPIQIGATDPTLSSFTPKSPLGLIIRTADFNNSAAPSSYQWNLSLQYELARNLVMEVAYSGLKSTRLVDRTNLNQISVENALAGRNLQVNRAFPNINNTVGFDAAIGNSNYNALNVRFEKRYDSGLNFLMNYTWSKNIESNGDGSSSYSQNGGTTFPLDTYNLAKERSYAPLDVPHVFILSYGYELPAGKGKRWLNRGGFADALLGGWQVNGITSVRSGFPTDIRSSRVAGNNQLFATINVPDRVPGVSMYLPNPGVDGYFNPAAFVEPQQVRAANGTLITLFGNAARRVGRGPGSFNTDFSLFKNFRIRERATIQFRAEAFNLTNTPTFFLPSSSGAALTIGNPGFGKLTSSSTTGRQLQLGLKIIF